jgi:L-ascorbate metabolism protein UlaG (beta-lactamase superfamily)
MDIFYHGHSCFELSHGDTRVLLDPFLKPNNPRAEARAGDVEPTHIAITHGHVDHMADALPVAERTGAHCVAICEIANWLSARGIENTSDPNLGGTVEFDWGYIALVPAWHTSTIAGSEEAPYSAEQGTPTGPAAGLLVKLGETTVYHAGDTCLFSDMKLIAERNPIDVALLPIGGHYTMDRRDGVVACEFVGAETVIPIHQGTFPAIETDTGAFKSEVEAQTSSQVVILDPGQTHSV